MPGTNPAIPVFGFATAIPTDTTQQYSQGTLLINSDPRAGTPFGWLCTAAGKPGTWIPLMATDQSSFTNLTAAGALSAGTTFGKVTNTAAATYTLAPAASYAAGAILTLISIGGAASTFAPATGNAVAGASAITAANTFLRLLSDGSTTWYNVS